MKNNSVHKERAQAATELAVFGAIIIFIVGAIIRSSLLTGYQQNQQLKAMKEALSLSYRSTYSGGTVGRNSSNIFYIEDRLSPEVAKYGSMDRQQFIMRGAGTMSNKLMYPIDAADLDNPANLPTMDFIINGKHFQFTMAAFVVKALNPPPGYSDNYATPPDPAANGTYRYKGWDFRCSAVGGVWYGCPLFYEHVARGAAGWCDGDPCSTISYAERFDLNRNDDFSDDPISCGPSTPPPFGKVCREDIVWQWNAVRGVQGAVNIDLKNANYPAYDVDNDKEEETIYEVLGYYPGGGISVVRALDFQEGDVNVSQNGGLKEEMAIYTRTKDGTYLKVQNGKLYNPETGIFVRSVSRADQVELIERKLVLNANTGNICDGAGSPSARNPSIEVCSNDCFSGGNKALTCYDTTRKSLFVRSRFLDRRGHFWLTDTTGGLP